MKIGLVCSTFDMMHAGHMLMLKDAASRCDRLVIGLQIDASQTPASYRGKAKPKPIMSLEERQILLEGCKYVHEIFLYTSEDELLEQIKKLEPHIRILGSDWKGKIVTGQELANEVYYHERNHNYSTTELKERIKNAE
jgi:glycerol-3-phosphate cytidylyltransferase